MLSTFTRRVAVQALTSMIVLAVTLSASNILSDNFMPQQTAMAFTNGTIIVCVLMIYTSYLMEVYNMPVRVPNK